VEIRDGTEEEWNKLPQSKTSTQWDDTLVELAAGKIKVISYEDDDQLKTMRRSLGRTASSRVHISLEYRVDTPNKKLWVRKSGDVTPKPITPGARRGRPRKTEGA
jgi:hypothetical protein